MKKIILTLGIILAALFTVNAQDAPEGKQATKMVDEYTSVAQLTPDQAAKIKPMIEAFFATRKDNKERFSGDAEGLRAANKSNRENLKAQLKTVLSPEQIQKIEEYNKQKKEERKGAPQEQQN